MESELSRVDAGVSAYEFANELSKPLALLTEAASNLFAIAESRTRAASGGDINTFLPTDDARAADYFRRLAGGSVTMRGSVGAATRRRAVGGR